MKNNVLKNKGNWNISFAKLNEGGEKQFPT